MAIFPLLLLATSILGFLFQGSEHVREWAVESTLRNFPIVGDQLGTPSGLQGSVAAVVVGSLIALYGAMGLGQSTQNAMHVVWSVPRNSRPNPIKLRVKSLLLLLLRRPRPRDDHGGVADRPRDGPCSGRTSGHGCAG